MIHACHGVDGNTLGPPLERARRRLLSSIRWPKVLVSFHFLILTINLLAIPSSNISNIFIFPKKPQAKDSPPPLSISKPSCRISYRQTQTHNFYKMAPIFSRYLLFPAPTSSPSSPMWDRPSAGTPIFIDASPSPSQMWSRPGTRHPIYEEAVPSPSPMWHRPAPSSPVPVCPCCMAHPDEEETTYYGGSSRPGSSDTVGSSSSSSADRRPSLRSVPSGLGLRLKKSFRSLRSRASRTTL